MANTRDRVDRDVELHFPGDRFPVTVGPVLQSTGWRGGLWVMYVDDPDEEYVVEVSDGTGAAGFLLPQSESYLNSVPNRRYGGQRGSPADWTNQRFRANIVANVVTMVSGGTRALFEMYETTALVGANRTGASITYTLNQPLKVSENGLLTNESDGALTGVGITSPVVVGIVSGVPRERNDFRLSVDLKY